jgi:anti-sigma factor RsiW
MADESPDQSMNPSAGDHPRLAESYLLSELSPEQRRAFELHLFDCPACAEEVTATADFLDGARQVLAREPSVTRPPRRRRGFPLPAVVLAPWAAAAALTLAVGYQSIVAIPALRRDLADAESPRALVATTLRPETRGEPVAIAADRFVTVALDFAPPPGAARLEGELANEHGQRVAPSFPIPLPPAGEPLQVLLPARTLAPATYILSIRAPGGEQTARFTFRLTRAR